MVVVVTKVIYHGSWIISQRNCRLAANDGGDIIGRCFSPPSLYVGLSDTITRSLSTTSGPGDEPKLGFCKIKVQVSHFLRLL